MKKIIAVLLCLVALLALLSCAQEVAEDEGLKIVCTSFVVADWVENIVGDSSDCRVVILGDKGKDMHNFQPAAADMRELLSSDLIIYIGGESDKWVESVALGENNRLMRLFDVIDGAHCESCLDGHDHDHGDAPDEHIWLSLENPLAVCEALAHAMGELDPDNKTAYLSSLADYSEKITVLHDGYLAAAESAKYKTLVFADRFPFVYLMNELGIEYLAAFPGCSSETSASFETVITLAGEVDRLGLGCVLVLEDSADGIAPTVIENTKSKSAQILAIDSMQIYSGDESFDYIEAMYKNLAAFKQAFGSR